MCLCVHEEIEGEGMEIRVVCVYVSREGETWVFSVWKVE